MRRLAPWLLVLGLVAPAPARAQLRLQEVARFDSPVHVVGAPGDYRRLYVVEQHGTISVFRNGIKLATPFADLRSEVRSPADGGNPEEGLLSMAFAPDFRTSGLLYVYFNTNSGDVRVDQLRADSSDQADLSYRRRVLEIAHPAFGNHNGGQLQFGPDGHLYLGTGDGGGGYDPPDNAQNTAALLGKLLRIDPAPGGAYTVPPDNPYVGGAGADEVWSHGLRNPFRFSFDRLTGDLSIGDVGQSTVEEVDFAPAATAAGRGANFGWDDCEGSYRSDPPPTSTSVPCPLSGDVRPVIEQFSSQGWCALIGGYVARDPSLAELSGRYVYGDACLGALRSAQLALPRASDDRDTGLRVESLSSFGEDTAGCLYAASLRGPVYRLVSSSTEVPCPDPADPRLTVRIPRGQRLLRRRAAIAHARCNERCTVTLRARLRIGRRSYRLRGARARAPAGRRVSLRARLSRRASRALRDPLLARARVTATFALAARDTAGNRSPTVRRSVRMRR